MNHELKQVEVRLKLVDKEGLFSKEAIDTPQRAVSLMAPILAELDREEVCVVNLDSKGHPINYNVVSIGSINASLVTGRELYKSAILSNAASMIMLHNHPSSVLSVSKMDRDVTEKMMYASILLDIEFLDHVIVGGGTGQMLSLRETYPYLFEASNYSNQIVHVADGVREEASYQGMPPTTYEILQIKRDSNGEPYRFMGMNYVQKKELSVNADDYESVYKGELKPGESLDTLYERFNLYHPKGFRGHSLSISDVIVLETPTEINSFYVDSVGFCKLQDFFADRFIHTEQEWKTIQTFRQQTEQYFRPVDAKSAQEIENEVRDFLYEKIREYDIPVQIGEVVLYGSRCRGTEKENSDIDIVVEYQGVSREDDLFNLFHEEDFYIGDVKVDINPIKEEKSGNIAEFLEAATKYMEQELAFSIEDRYISIQEVYDGYDYTIYGEDFKEIDGGVYDNPDISIYEALHDIVEDLKKNPDTNGAKGKIKESSTLVPINKEMFDEAVEKSNYIPPRITFTVAECSEYHQMARYHDNIETAEEAIALWREYQNSPLNGVPAIGILVHTPGQPEMEDEQVDLVTGNWLDLDMIGYYPTIRKEQKVIELIADLIGNLREVKVIGKMPTQLSTELLLRELDPKREILSEEERSLIQNYALQMKDMQKTRELAERICYQEEFGNQDVAPAVIEARKEMQEAQEKKEEKMYQRKR